MHPTGYLCFTLLSILGFAAESHGQPTSNVPQLVVNIVIDQLRTDCLETFAPLYGDDGLKRILAEGRIYPNASYSFRPADKAAATATLSTGTTPYYHGITAEEWLDRSTLRPARALHDKEFGLSPRQLQASTVGDELKINTQGAAKVYAFSADAESAILLAGHAADGAAWIEHARWGTSPYYTPASQWLTSFIRLNAPTPDANRSIVKAALECIAQTGIGHDNQTDLLNIALTATPDQDSYTSLDRDIAELLNGISSKMPLQRVLFVITSTENKEDEQEEELARYRIPTGKFSMSRTANLLNMYLGAIYGIEQYIEACYQNQLFVNYKIVQQKNIDISELLQRSQDFILQLSGVRNVYSSHQLRTESSLPEHVRNGFNSEKCGDLIIGIAPGWQLVNDDYRQTSISRASCTPFPILFFGSNIKAERIETAVTTDRIAPTITRAIRIRAPNACASMPLF